MRTKILWCAALAAIGSIEAGQKTSQPEPRFQTTTRIVEVNVEATSSGGSMVRDLTRSELRLFDNGREQIIGTWEKIPTGAAEGKGSEATPRARRLSILLLSK